MASVIETRLSTRVERGFSSIPGYFTTVTSLRSGVERRQINWSSPRHKYTARYASWTAEDRAELLNLIHACRGMAYAFLFKDWNDYKVVNQSLGAAPSGTTAVQLVKTYTFGATTYTRNITRPRASSVIVYQDGTPKAGTVDATTGLFTPSSGWTPGAALTWTGEFDVPVRFATDDVEFILPHRDISEVNCELLEVKDE